jgi:hypothetical protein
MRTGEASASAIWQFVAESAFHFVIPNEVRNLSSIENKSREIPRQAACLGMTK